LRRVDGDEDEENAVEKQIRQVEIFSIRIPLHLQIFLAQWVRQQLNPPVMNHRLRQKFEQNEKSWKHRSAPSRKTLHVRVMHKASGKKV
jgi:hypothetical protein